MTARLIHTADTHLRSPPPNDRFDAFAEVVYLAKRQTLDGVSGALVHTGDLFQSPQPPSSLVDAVIDLLNNDLQEGTSNPPDVYFISGNHDESRGGAPALEHVIANTDAEWLSTTPTTVGSKEVVLYGVDYRDRTALRDGILSFDTPPANTPVFLCLHGVVAEHQHQQEVRYQSRHYTLDDIQHATPFDNTGLLCGHLHETMLKARPESEDPSILYPGAPECVRENLKSYFPIAFRIEVENYSETSHYHGKVTPVSTHARPWIVLERTVNTDTSPDDIVSEVFDEWEYFLHTELPELRDRYEFPYTEFAMKEPNIEVTLDTSRQASISDSFLQGIEDELREWGHAHTVVVERNN